jgi:hypothetical protein
MDFFQKNPLNFDIFKNPFKLCIITSLIEPKYGPHNQEICIFSQFSLEIDVFDKKEED